MMWLRANPPSVGWKLHAVASDDPTNRSACGLERCGPMRGDEFDKPRDPRSCKKCRRIVRSRSAEA